MSERSIESYEQYRYAYKLGKKSVSLMRHKGLDTHLAVLDDKVNAYECSKEYLGEMNVPARFIVGTMTRARAVSFSADFMPLLNERSEFAAKWRNVCEYHLSDTGITEAPKAYEYLGKFYIIEGNKRVSVLKSYGAVFIALDVIRLLPEKKKKREIEAYYEFLNFYEQSKLYSLQFSKKEYYYRFNKLAGFSRDHKWTRQEQIAVAGFLDRLEPLLQKHDISTDRCDCMVDLMSIYGYDGLLSMKDKDLSKAVSENKIRLSHNHGLYKIVCVSDIADMGLYSDYARIELSDVDFLISCGDLDPEYLEFLVTMSNKPLFYVHGNHDSRLDSKPPGGCTCVDDDLIIYQGIRILGLGGSLRYSKSKYQYTELEMVKRIRRLRRKIHKAGGIDIVISHAAVRGHGDMDDYAHQGFECFEKLIMDYHPKYWFFGHIHLNYSFNLPREYEFKGCKIINCYDKYEATY